MHIELYSLPKLVLPRKLDRRSAVAVDVLRAGTTIVTALESGATEVIPCLDIDTARKTAQTDATSVLGGERKGMKIDGFDLDNSPSSYRAGRVANRRIVFTTTNGTRAIDACRTSAITLIGSFVNLQATADRLLSLDRNVAIVCAGTDGHPSLEDVIFGGALCERLGEVAGSIRLNFAARAALETWKLAQRQIQAGSSLDQLLRQTQGGQNLCQLNLQADIRFAAQLNKFKSVPVLDAESGSIRLDVDLATERR